jgi:hypothetical protein
MCSECTQIMRELQAHFHFETVRSVWGEVQATWVCCALYPYPDGTSHKDICNPASKGHCFRLLEHVEKAHPEQYTIELLKRGQRT